MSLPASAPTGLSVASFRASLARGVAASRPALRLWLGGLGGAAPGEYRSPFPARLRAARAAIVVLALLWLVVGFSGLNATGAIVRVVGHDTAPSVAAAQAIRTGLAGANADFALSTLANEGPEGAFLSDMRLQLRAVRAALVEAAGNVTYGDEERGPIGTVLQGLGDYEQLVGRSAASAGAARRDLAFAADDLLHWTALPAAASLERVNADHLAQDYSDYEGRRPAVWVAIAAAVLLVALAAVQVDVARTAKRLINPGLLLATLAVACATALLVWRLGSAQADLRVAKLSAFDSVYTLTSAQALATDADAAEAFAALAVGDQPHVAKLLAKRQSLQSRLLDADPDVASKRIASGSPVSGYLGDEFANVTFEGERAAASVALRAWTSVVRAWDAVQRAGGTFVDRAPQGQPSPTVSALTQNNGPVRQALRNFDAALAKVIGINRDAFAASIASAERDDAPLGAALAVGFVVAVAFAWFGIGRRLDEYRF